MNDHRSRSQDNSQRGGLGPLLVLGGLAYYVFVRPQMNKWGTYLGESQRRLAGDDLIPEPNIRGTYAIDIDAPPEAVWPWLMQMGRDRTGWYAIDIIDNNGIPSASYLRKDIKPPEANTQLDLGYRVRTIEDHKHYILARFDAPLPFDCSLDSSLVYRLERKTDGSSRLLMRFRGYTYGPANLLLNLVLEIVHFFTFSTQLKNIKDRAETMAHLHMPADDAHEIVLS